MEKHDPPVVGEIYERDGRRREVREVIDPPHYDVIWARPGEHLSCFRAWCATWREWVSKAKRVQ